MHSTSPKPFAEAARIAFPTANRVEAEAAVACLAPLVDDSYRQPSFEFAVLGETVRIPRRLHLPGLSISRRDLAGMPPPALCLVSRATDGHLRQAAVTALFDVDAPWAAPYVATLAADYVREIAQAIHEGLPRLNQALYANMVRENRGVFRTLSDRATSYWNAYYRHLYRERRDYPGLKSLREMESWAKSPATS